MALVGKTTNFVVEYDDALKGTALEAAAQRQGDAILACCESDYTTMVDWMFYHPTNLYTPRYFPIIVRLVKSAGGNPADNQPVFDRYHFEEGDPLIRVSVQGGHGDDIDNDAACSLMVAELIEVLMAEGQVPGKTPDDPLFGWNPGGSDGEALSRVMAAVMHEVGYYQGGLGPTVNKWFSSGQAFDAATSSYKAVPRADWISKRSPGGDGDQDAWGCGMLLLYYLTSQLGYSWLDVLSSTADTLEQRFELITGRKNGYAELTGLLDEFYVPTSLLPTLPSDNPFPLVPATRSVYLSRNQSILGTRVTASAAATIEAKCYGGTYDYDALDQFVHMACVAHVSGFAQPQYKWKINGIDVVPSAGGKTYLSTPVQTLTDDPDHPDDPTPGTATAQVDYGYSDASSYKGLAQELYLENVANAGRQSFVVSVEVSELDVPGAAVTMSEHVTLDTQVVRYDDGYYKARLLCGLKAKTILNRLPIDLTFHLIKTLPDPIGPLWDAARVLAEGRRELAQLAAVDADAARMIEAEFGAVLGGLDSATAGR